MRNFFGRALLFFFSFAILKEAFKGDVTMFGYMLEDARKYRDLLEKQMKDIDDVITDVENQMEAVDQEIKIAKIEEEIEEHRGSMIRSILGAALTSGLSFGCLEILLSSLFDVSMGQFVFHTPTTLGVICASIFVTTPILFHFVIERKKMHVCFDFMDEFPEEEKKDSFLCMLQEKSVKQLLEIQKDLKKEKQELEEEKTHYKERYGKALEKIHELQSWEDCQVKEILADSKEEFQQFEKNPESMHQKLEYLLFQAKLNAYSLEHPEFKKENFFDTTFYHGEIVSIYPEYAEQIKKMFGQEIFENEYFRMNYPELFLGEEIENSSIPYQKKINPENGTK